MNGETGVVVLDAGDVGAVPTARTITAGTGLTGGGDLSADRTLTVTYGATAGTAAAGDDARLSDARTPTAHAASHQDGGSDELALDGSQITTGTVAAARLGSGTASAGTVLHGDGTWTEQPTSGCPFTPGRTYATTSAHPTGNAFSSSEVTFVPWPVGRAGVVISTMGIVVNTAAAGGKIHLGIYSSVGGLPATLIGTLGFVTTDSTGYVSIAGSLPIPMGLVWLAIKPFGGSLSLLANVNTRMNEYVPSNTSSPYHQYTMTVCKTTHAADSLPATIAPGNVGVWNILPMIHIGASA